MKKNKIIEMAQEYELQQGIINREKRERARLNLKGGGFSFIEIFRKIKEINKGLKVRSSGHLRLTTVHLPLKYVTILDVITAYFQYPNRSELIREAVREYILTSLNSVGVTQEELREIWR